MSQNAMLDRETVAATGETARTDSQLEVEMPNARAQREHLTLVDWEPAAPTVVARNFAPVRLARRRWFGWSEASMGILLLASGAAAVASLLRLQ